MPGLVFVNTGISYLANLWPLSDDQFLHIWLFVNDVPITPTTVLGDLVRAAPIPVDSMPLIDPDQVLTDPDSGVLVLQYMERQFIQTEFTPGQAAYGYFLVREPDILVAAERFDSPQNWIFVGQQINVTPKLRLFSFLIAG